VVQRINCILKASTLQYIITWSEDGRLCYTECQVVAAHPGVACADQQLGDCSFSPAQNLDIQQVQHGTTHYTYVLGLCLLSPVQKHCHVVRVIKGDQMDVEWACMKHKG